MVERDDMTGRFSSKLTLKQSANKALNSLIQKAKVDSLPQEEPKESKTVLKDEPKTISKEEPKTVSKEKTEQEEKIRIQLESAKHLEERARRNKEKRSRNLTGRKQDIAHKFDHKKTTASITNQKLFGDILERRKKKEEKYTFQPAQKEDRWRIPREQPPGGLAHSREDSADNDDNWRRPRTIERPLAGSERPTTSRRPRESEQSNSNDDNDSTWKHRSSVKREEDFVPKGSEGKFNPNSYVPPHLRNK
jgi:hypothetical protein